MRSKWRRRRRRRRGNVEKGFGGKTELNFQAREFFSCSYRERERGKEGKKMEKRADAKKEEKRSKRVE